MTHAISMDDNQLDSVDVKTRYELTEMFFLAAILFGEFLLIWIFRYITVPLLIILEPFFTAGWVAGMCVYWMRKRKTGYGYFRYSSRPYALGILQAVILIILVMLFFVPKQPGVLGYPFLLKLISVTMTILIWPFLEELFYRGLMFEHLSRNLGVILAMLITSAFFTVQHLPHQGWQISHIFFSIGMCVLYLIFKNLLLQISFHSLSNTIHIVKNIPDMATYATVISICFVIVLMIIGIARGKHPYDIEDRIVPGWGKVP